VWTPDSPSVSRCPARPTDISIDDRHAYMITTPIAYY
jgi:hypothetical protein